MRRRSSTAKVAVESVRQGSVEGGVDESESLLTLTVSERKGYIDTMENVVGVGVIGGSSAPPIMSFNAETGQVLGWNPEFTTNCEGVSEKKVASGLMEAVARGKNKVMFQDLGNEYTPVVTGIGGNVKIILLREIR
ncbi:hypothetical protein TL16_g06217 [Triparma laevis f. inornata]|uniref:Uncharacterized protein n=1 Tax=Triparma laevis f. inornata TaxID=1714386 RepID=A0A9W7AM20_9STRA|nr:hypothetical protein TL16_g06217 [Triparma laevis f. inornata]